MNTLRWARPIGVLFAALLAVQSLSAQRGQPKVDVTPLVETDPAARGADLHLALTVQIPKGYHTNSNKPRDPNLIPVTLTFGALPPGVTVSELVFPDAVDLKQQGSDQPLRVFDGAFIIGATLKVAGDAPAGKVELPAVFRYQACDEVACYAPKSLPAAWKFTIAAKAGAKLSAETFRTIAFGTGDAPGTPTPATAATSTAPASASTGADALAALDRFTETGTTFGYLGVNDFAQFIRDAENGVRPKGLFEGQGPLAILLIVLVGGLALNLTPCVLPMIPINLAIIGAGTQAGSRRRGFLLGGTYGAAMAFVYGVLGLIVVLTASTFGTINSYWWFNAAIAALFVVLALAMFDVIVIDFSRFSSSIRVGEPGRGSFLVAFGMGAVAALLAGACVAPVVIQVVLFSSNLYANGSPSALALPFLLGVGMAIPWPIAGAGLAALPKPGAWMVRIKQLFGVIILATAAYYGYEAYSILSNTWVDAREVQESVEKQLKAGWQPSLAEGLAIAEREQKPVLIDTWATWCKNCLVMDRTTLTDPTITQALSGYVKIKFQAENPDDPQTAAVMQKLGATGMPTYVILKTKN
jgi:thiol:disulfide interchange protein